MLEIRSLSQSKASESFARYILRFNYLAALNEELTQILKTMKRVLLYFFGLVVLLSQTSCGYNEMVSLDEGVKNQWANVQNAYQRRSDLIPNLVNTVKGAA